MGDGEPEVGEDSVPLVVGDEAVVRFDRGDTQRVVAVHHLAQVLGIEATRQRRRADEVDEHHREMASFAVDPSGAPIRRGVGIDERRAALVTEAVIRSIALSTGGARPDARRLRTTRSMRRRCRRSDHMPRKAPRLPVPAPTSSVRNGRAPVVYRSTGRQCPVWAASGPDCRGLAAQIGLWTEGRPERTTVNRRLGRGRVLRRPGTAGRSRGG